MPQSTRLIRIRIEKLFGRHTYDIDLTRPITIITSGNGYGKTTILTFLQILSEKSFVKLKNPKYTFDCITYFFDDGSELNITYDIHSKRRGTPERNIETQTKKIIISLNVNGKKEQQHEISDIYVEADRLDHILQREFGYITRVGEYAWKDTRSGSIYNYEQALALFADFTRETGINYRIKELPEWLQNINVNSMSINANRLNNMQYVSESMRYPSAVARRSTRELRNSSVVYDVSEQIKQEYESVKSQQIIVSRERESSFVQRLVKEYEKPTKGSMNTGLLKELQQQIRKYEERFTKLNLIKEAKRYDNLPQDGRYFEMIKLYYDDILARFAKIEPIANRLEKFTELINKLYGPEITLKTNEDGIRIFHGSDEIDLHSLSSGQQHLLVIFGKLFFEVQDNYMLYIDEPEISLHGSWQLEFINIVKQAIKGYKNVHVIIATHSPLIYSQFIQSNEIVDLEMIDEANHA